MRGGFARETRGRMDRALNGRAAVVRGLVVAALAALAAFVAPASLRAQPVQGVYVSLGAGYNFLDDEGTRPAPGIGLGGSNLTFNGGAAMVGSVGYAFGNGFRLELEGDDLFGNALHARTGTPVASAASGNQSTAGTMLNALFDFDIGSRYVFPYVGVGGGYQWSTWNGMRTVTPGTGETLNLGGTAGNLAFQGIVGISFPVPHTPGLSVTAEYRYMGMLGPEGFHATVDRPGAAPVAGNFAVMENLNQSVLLGIRYAFSVPPPPVASAPATAAAAVPAPVPVRTYLVFFDWDSADLTDRARQVIAEAAQGSTRVRTTRIEVSGYADRSGTAQYNRKLSLRRADAVTAELVRDGVAREQIGVAGYGDSNPLVPTAAGVREAQNRRVEIVLK